MQLKKSYRVYHCDALPEEHRSSECAQCKKSPSGYCEVSVMTDSIKLVNGELTRGEKAFYRLLMDAKVSVPCRLSRIPVGHMFFDENKTMYMVVGFKKGFSMEDATNSIVIEPSGVDTFAGKPVRHLCSKIVTPVM